MSDFKVKMQQIDFGWGYAPDPAAESYSASLGPLAEFKGPNSKVKEGTGWKLMPHRTCTTCISLQQRFGAKSQ